MEMTIVAAPTPINKSGGEQHPNNNTAAIDDNAENGEGTSSKSRSPITVYFNSKIWKIILTFLQELKLHQRFGIPMQAMNGESDEEEVPHSTKSLKPVDLMGTGPLISRKVCHLKISKITKHSLHKNEIYYIYCKNLNFQRKT